MQGLKALVVGMGVLIVVSLGLLAWGFYSKLSTPEAQREPAAESGQSPPDAGAPAEPQEVAGRHFGEARIELPAGCTLSEMRSEPDRLYVRTGPVGLCERILVLDPRTGALLGTFVFRP